MLARVDSNRLDVLQVERVRDVGVVQQLIAQSLQIPNPLFAPVLPLAHLQQPVAAVQQVL